MTEPAEWIRLASMIRGGFLSEEERRRLIGIARDGLEEHRIARRANAIVLLDKGWSCSRVATALLLDDDTIRIWRRAYESGGVECLRNFDHEGGACRLNEAQQAEFKAWVTARLPRSANVVGDWLRKTYGLSYSRPGLILLLHRLGFDYRTPRRVPRHLDEARQQAFIDYYEKLLNGLGSNEAIVSIDAVHPTHQVRAAGCWAPKGVALAVEQTTGRQSLNIHGAINLETGKTQMVEVQKVDSRSLMALLDEIEAAHPTMQRVHVFLDNATYHRARAVREWIAQRGHKTVLHFVPTYCPHLAPIERCWGVMHEFVTHNRDYRTFQQFRRAILTFLRQTIPSRWDYFCDRITDNFRVISPREFRVVA